MYNKVKKIKIKGLTAHLKEAESSKKSTKWESQNTGGENIKSNTGMGEV